MKEIQNERRKKYKIEYKRRGKKIKRKKSGDGKMKSYDEKVDGKKDKKMESYNNHGKEKKEENRSQALNVEDKQTR